MTKSTKRLLENQGVALAKQVAARRLRMSGIKLEGKLKLSLSNAKAAKKDRLPASLLKRLAGV